MKLGELESFKNPQVPSHPTSRPNNGTPPNPKRATGRPGSPGERLESSRLVCQLLLRFCANPGTDHAHVARLCAVPLGETTGQAAEVLGVGFETFCQQLLSVHFFSAWVSFFFGQRGLDLGARKVSFLRLSVQRSQQCTFLVVQHFVKGEVPPQWFSAAMCAMERGEGSEGLTCAGWGLSNSEVRF